MARAMCRHNAERTLPLFSCNALSGQLACTVTCEHRAGENIATQQMRVHDAVFLSLAAIARKNLDQSDRVRSHSAKEPE